MKYRSKEQAYQSNEWKKLRKQKLETCPRCELCQLRNIDTPATQVHHLLKFDQQYDKITKAALFLDYENLLSVCSDCHKQIHGKQSLLFPEQLNYITFRKNYICSKYYANGIILKYTNDKNVT